MSRSAHLWTAVTLFFVAPTGWMGAPQPFFEGPMWIIGLALGIHQALALFVFAAMLSEGVKGWLGASTSPTAE